LFGAGPVGGGGEPLRQVLFQARALGTIGLDKALVNAPGGSNRSVTLIGQQGPETPSLGVGEQVGFGH